MKQETIELWKNAFKTKRWKELPQCINDLAIEVLDKYGVYIKEYSSQFGSIEIFPIEVFHESVQFDLDCFNDDKRHFKQSELDKIVKRHENFYFGYYCKSDGSCPNSLIFKFKRPEC